MGPPKDRGEEWFIEIYLAHYERIVRYGLRRLYDGDVAAEVAQEVFVIAWRRRAEVPQDCLPWLYAVARRVLANNRRDGRAAPQVTLFADVIGGGGRTMVMAQDSLVAVAGVRAALATLPGIDQEILRLIGWEELSLGEAAAVLCCTRTTAAVRLHRARKRMAKALNAQLDREG
ncbi:sigma-70 family RNA polymerase sigma factor [Micromonospora sp. KC213]|uniref:RNA polymerase sigma factor n=1 Tax=Micromonospora sp. KC213 TaxID=2530378 RepID=UPI00104A8A01|nr:sigma-70 family RNA polymerase sigma factor [Micromonospora sp. KC213]TDC38325.1 sigma-70 family RNA polymerase sigma factor [Micromonospora sp. KC213]